MRSIEQTLSIDGIWAVEQTLSTGGNGYWSEVAKEVVLTGMELAYEAELEEGDTECKHGELRVYFSTKSWDVNVDGLIYTDCHFMSELADYLTRAGYIVDDVGYSEQGMQGDNYVSLDVGANFIRSWKATQHD